MAWDSLGRPRTICDSLGGLGQPGMAWDGLERPGMDRDSLEGLGWPETARDDLERPGMALGILGLRLSYGSTLYAVTINTFDIGPLA